MIHIRNCAGHDELEACVDLQVQTWGYDPTDVIPRKAFLVWQKVGGQVIGAFDSEIPGASPSSDANSSASNSLVGFVLALPGIKSGNLPGTPNSGQAQPKPYLHSHMMAVKAGYRDRGLGRRLKLAQREEALSRGIHLIEWTFDPHEIKNAFLNIRKLGAIVRTYHVDFYGASSSRLQGGLPTDRLVAEWNLDSPHVRSTLAGTPSEPVAIAEQIHVPATIYEWKADNAARHQALAVQLENRRKFQQAFSQGLAVVGFARDAEGNGIYQLGQPSQLDLLCPR